MNQNDSSPDTRPPDASASRLPAQGWGLLDMTLDGIVLLDDQGCILDANGRALEFLHSSLTAVSGFDIWDVVPQEITEQHQEATRQALGVSAQYSFITHQDFENSWLEYTFRKHPQGYVVNLREAGSTQRLQRLLEDSKRYNQLIFEANPNAMWVFDLTTLRIFAVNQAAVKFYGISRKVFITLGMDALFPEGEGVELLNSLRPGTDSKDARSEMRLCRQKKMDGKQVLVELAWSRVKWDGHQAVLVSLADLSDRHFADNALKSANAELTQALLAQQEERDPTRNVTIEMTGSLMLVGHKNLLTTALSCLLGNAWKFTSRKPEAWIKIGVQPGKAVGERVLVVADNGVGFDPVYGGNLFTAFQRLHSSADFPGNGLGLAIIKRVAQIHGGTVWAESADKVGASFFMALPQPAASTA